MDELLERLACPRCGNDVLLEGSVVNCSGKCGQVGRYELGILDFLWDTESLPQAGGGVFELGWDDRYAHELAERAETLSLDELVRSTERMESQQRTPRSQRLHDHYTMIEEEVGLRHGDAIVQKVNAALASQSVTQPLGRGWALEAGGARGAHIPGFSRTFDRVVLVDCLFNSLIFAKKLVEELSLTNVHIVRADATALPFKSDIFAFVHENGVIEHVAEPQELVNEATRVSAPGGVYACLSPNRYSMGVEPHFRLLGFGFIPKRFRNWILRRYRGLQSEAGTELRSLSELRRYFAGTSPFIFFLAPHLQETARSSPVRRFVVRVSRTPLLGSLLWFIINRLLLPVTPYHFVLVRR